MSVMGYEHYKIVEALNANVEDENAALNFLLYEKSKSDLE